MTGGTSAPLPVKPCPQHLAGHHGRPRLAKSYTRFRGEVPLMGVMRAMKYAVQSQMAESPIQTSGGEAEMPMATHAASERKIPEMAERQWAMVMAHLPEPWQLADAGAE